ncbi:EAL domain-containing protein [Sulfurimonas hydrogeniphila]|uniref:EAL domain-containing protein n=1 Tax=Sulfurimonas hydrogeniphila TaxID=2509341 RepID=UPI00165F7A0F|nr:EAL domain-containing protein [Sulfurimonas hydrogeniphila]
MKYLNKIKHSLPLLLDNIEKEIRNDESISFLISETQLNNLITEQKALLIKYFEYYHHNIDEKLCWHFYKDANVPFLLIYKSLQLLKVEIMNELLLQTDNKVEVLKVSNDINNLLNLIAKIYIRKEIDKPFSSLHKFQNYLLFRTHVMWYERIIKAIRKDDLSLFPLFSSLECDFSKYLEYPESLMICIDLNLCKQLHDLHHIVHKNANIFYLYYKKEEYYQAYLAYKELEKVINIFTSTLMELYFQAYNNLEENFFRLLESFLYQKKHVYLTMIDIKGLKKLNARYGEANINTILENISISLQNTIDKQASHMLLIKGVTANYYMMSIELESEEYLNIHKDIYAVVNQTYQNNGKSIPVESSVVSLNLLGFHGKTSDDFIKLMHRLKFESLSQAKKSYHIESKKECIRLVNWLEDSYKNLDFIIQKLEEEEIEAVFQPIYNIKENKLEVVEALARIRDGKKLIPAGVFIDQVIAIDKDALLDSLMLKDLIKKREKIFKAAKILFVNLSFKSLFNEEFKQQFEKFIEVYKNDIVVFELTEQSLIENIDVIEKMYAKYGFHFAVDDFGSGYSSLKLVSDLAKRGLLKVLKMDGTLIEELASDEQNQKIVKVIAELSNIMELVSVAEYIETEEVFNLVKTYNITYAQGFHLSKPKEIDELLIEKLNE